MREPVLECRGLSEDV